MYLAVMVFFCLVFLAVISYGFRMFSFGVLGLALGAIAWAISFGSDKPQTFFYNSYDHPAFLMREGSVCPPDRHIWNGWCVK